MLGELVWTTTPDYLRLHGFYQTTTQSVRTSASSGQPDAAILLHGLGGNFYSSRLLSQFATTLHSLGLATVLANTRGHDMINTSSWGAQSRSVGAALERVSDCVHDVAGWVDFLERRGHSRILLLGHSLGAIKSIYTQAFQPVARVASMIALSATPLSHRRLMDSPRGALFRETIDRCRGLVEGGAGDVPIQVPFPFPTWMTPAGYLEKYGPQETYHWPKFISQVEVPSLMLFGQRELDTNPAFDGLAAFLENESHQWSAVDVEVIEEADHFYTARIDAVADAIGQWLTR